MGNLLLYYLIIFPLSLLPMPVLHGFSSMLYIPMYHLIGYRKKVIMTNLRNAFPEKTEQEQKAIARAFYKHLCDLIFESIKIFSFSERQIRKRMTAKNPELIERFFDEGRSVLLVGGHYNNWELYAVGAPFLMKHQTIAIYRKLKSPFWDEKMRSSRERTGMQMISTKIVAQYFQEQIAPPQDLPKAVIFATDQSPGNVRKAHWVKFLHQDTAVMKGTEKYAVAFNTPVIYGHISKKKRGYYEIEYTTLTDQPKDLSTPGYLTELHTGVLEEKIRSAPEFWLWSHKRWKHKRPSNHT